MNRDILIKLIQVSTVDTGDIVKVTGSKVKISHWWLKNLVNIVAPGPMKGFWRNLTQTFSTVETRID